MQRDRTVHLICALVGALASLIVIRDYVAGKGDPQPSPEPPATVAPAPTPAPLPLISSPEPSAEVSETVVRTPSGKRYHRATCGHVKGKGIELSLKEAAERGLTPCKICNPPPLP